MELPSKPELDRCAKCGDVLPLKWYGNLSLQVSQDIIEAEHHKPWFQDLQRTGDDISKRLCWSCLRKIIDVVFAWRDED